MLPFEVQEIQGVADSKTCFSCDTRHSSVVSLQLANLTAINHLSFPPVYMYLKTNYLGQTLHDLEA